MVLNEQKVSYIGRDPDDPSSIDEDEILGDEEMMQYIKRTQARKIAHGAKKEELDEMLKFPEPFPPGRPSSPASE